MDENENMELDNIITLQDEDGNDVPYEFLDLVEYEGKNYVVLLPVLEEGEEDDGEVVILQVQDCEEDPELEEYLSVDDENVLMAVFEIFRERFAEQFQFEE